MNIGKVCEFMVKVNIHQLLTIAVLQFTINDKTLHWLFSLLIGNLIVGQVVLTFKIVKYDIMTEEKYAIFISLSHDCQLVDHSTTSIVLLKVSHARL